MTIGQNLQKSYKLLKNIVNFHLDAELIVAHVLGKTREFVLAHPEYTIPKLKIKKLKLKIARRRCGEPLAYILGHKEFYGLDFKVTPDTLIPRPETELLVEESLRALRNTLCNNNVTLIDIGTGSGNIIISIIKNISELCHSRLRGNDNCKFYATDISGKALRVAKFNALKNKVNKKIKFIESDLLNIFIQDTKYKIRATNLLIVANLPYLSKKIYGTTAPDVKNFEPKSALLSGKDGLEHYEKLFQQIKNLLDSYFLLHTLCFLEISPEQKPKINKLVRKYFPSVSPSFSRDLAGKWRVVSFNIA
jgi:release factor glutamine methyltransferase